MENPKKKYPPCFGRLETVFPMGPDGLRHTPDSCFACSDKTECLRAAVRGAEGTKVRGEKIDREYKSGHIGFFSRWSKRKQLHRQLQHPVETGQKGRGE